MADFSLYAHAFLDPAGKPAVSVSVNIPHTSLIFLKKGRSFQSEYAAYVKVLDKKKALVDTAVLTETVVVEGYETTRSAKSSSRVSKRFYLEPGEYLVECSVEVKNTLRVFQKEVTVTVPVFPERGVGVGKPRLFAVGIDTSTIAPVLADAGAYEPLEEEELASPFFAELDKHPVVRFETYAKEEGGDSSDCELYFEVLDGNKTVHAYGRRKVRMGGLRNDYIVYLNVDRWEPGSYVFTVKAVQLDPAGETAASLEFTLGYTRAMLSKYIDRTMEILSLIATKEEIDRFKAAAERDRDSLWVSFWERRDPSPGGENEALREHLRRVQYAIDNYSDAAQGWQSDRGKVYIKYGEPDHTEVRIDPQHQGEYLVWYYYEQNVTFVFYDRFGLGEYRLTDSNQL
jgi:GWxTD domain-containing protein